MVLLVSIKSITQRSEISVFLWRELILERWILGVEKHRSDVDSCLFPQVCNLEVQQRTVGFTFEQCHQFHSVEGNVLAVFGKVSDRDGMCLS